MPYDPSFEKEVRYNYKWTTYRIRDFPHYIYPQINIYYLNNFKSLEVKYLSVKGLFKNDLFEHIIHYVTMHKCSLTSGWWPNILDREENLFYGPRAMWWLSVAFA